MNRRDLLRGAGAALGGGALAGCLSSDGGEPGSDATNTTDSTDTTTGSGGLGSGGNDTTDSAGDGADDGDQRSTPRGTTDDGEGGGGHSITTTGTDCRSEGDEHAASVTVAEGEIEVTGTVVVSDPCHAAAFGTIERRDGDLVVVVEPEADDEVCMQCVGVVEYAATVAVDRTPATVTVKHRSRGRTRTVETASA